MYEMITSRALVDKYERKKDKIFFFLQYLPDSGKTLESTQL